MTAQPIALKLGITANVLETFQSIYAGVIAGLTEADAQTVAPNYMKDLSLYRLGLLSSYELRVPSGGEPLGRFENRIVQSMTEIFERCPDENIVIVAHRSPITAMLIDFARQFYRYPKQFFGYIPLESGTFSVLRYSDSGGEILGINCRRWSDTNLKPLVTSGSDRSLG